MLCGPWPEDTLTVVAHRAVWPADIYDSIPFFKLLLPELSEGPCGPGGEPHGASWGDKEGRAEGSGANLGNRPEVSAGPTAPAALSAATDNPGDASSCQGLRSGRRSGNIHHDRHHLSSGNNYVQVTFDVNLTYANLN